MPHLLRACLRSLFWVSGAELPCRSLSLGSVWERMWLELAGSWSHSSVPVCLRSEQPEPAARGEGSVFMERNAVCRVLGSSTPSMEFIIQADILLCLWH